ncbi:hypothetical protein NIES2104_52720 [Leptolyngbya sp. NIES-2104]|nr:hypothetical protein NIES2104_52720 [Leptolyngbya sp. NIES-2104]
MNLHRLARNSISGRDAAMNKDTSSILLATIEFFPTTNTTQAGTV